VNVLGSYRVPHHRFLTACKNRDVFATRDVTHHACIALRQFERNVAGDGCHADYLELFGRRHGEEQCNRVILTRIAVDDDWAWSH
jgi:hypothetical protein